eukprot:750985-Hanusia_phi.AAC.2
MIGLYMYAARLYKDLPAGVALEEDSFNSQGRPDVTSDFMQKLHEEFKSKVESVEWLNGIIRHVWLRYPRILSEVIRTSIINEILEGLRRDSVLPAGPIRDILISSVTLRESSPWIIDVQLNPMRSLDEVCITARVRFVSDKDAGVELNIKGPSNIMIPIKVENISVETKLLIRLHLKDEFPFLRVIWISMLEKPNLDLSILPLGGLDVMRIPGLDLMLHDLIMKGIEQEIVLPMGKIVAIEKFQPDDYYKEKGHVATERDRYSGVLTLFLEEAKMMLHPSYKESSAQDLYIRVTLGKQQFRTHKIINTFHESLHERFEFFVAGRDDEVMEIQLVCIQDGITYEPVLLLKISVKELLGEDFKKPFWKDIPDITNARMLLRCTYAPFRDPLATLTSQYSPSKEFIGGRSDWIHESSKAFRTQMEKKRAVRLGAAPVQLAKEAEEDRYYWKELLPRRQYKSLIWVTIHGAEKLMPKIIGTRDPYVRIQLGNQVEKTTAKLNSMNPTWEETFAMFASDVLNEEIVLTLETGAIAWTSATNGDLGLLVAIYARWSVDRKGDAEANQDGHCSRISENGNAHMRGKHGDSTRKFRTGRKRSKGGARSPHSDITSEFDCRCSGSPSLTAARLHQAIKNVKGVVQVSHVLIANFVQD